MTDVITCFLFVSVMPASTKDGATGKNFETQRGRLFVALEPGIDGTLELAQKIETKEHS